MSDAVDDWLDADFVADPICVGALAHDRGAVRFTYDPAWLQHPLSFALDLDLSLGEGVFHPSPDQGNFRVFDVLNLDETDSRPSLDTVIETSEWYLSSKDHGAAIVAQIVKETRQWRTLAAGIGISRADIELTAVAFAQSETFKD